MQEQSSDFRFVQVVGLPVVIILIVVLLGCAVSLFVGATPIRLAVEIHAADTERILTVRHPQICGAYQAVMQKAAGMGDPACRRRRALNTGIPRAEQD